MRPTPLRNGFSIRLRSMLLIGHVARHKQVIKPLKRIADLIWILFSIAVLYTMLWVILA